MYSDFFFNNRKIGTMKLEHCIHRFENFDDFENYYTDEFLNEDARVGMYLQDLLIKYDQKASVVSFNAHLAHSYVGNLMNGKKNNPSRDTLINICLALHTSVDELQNLLKYSGHAPLYVRKKRDVIIWFGLMKKESIEEVNENMIKRGFKALYKE